MRIPDREANRAKTLFFQHPAPCFRRQPGRAWFAQPAILVGPPTRQQAERQMREQLVAAHFVDDQQAIAPQRALDVSHRAVDVAGRMQHVGRDHDVVPAAIDPLLRKRPLDIQDPAAQ